MTSAAHLSADLHNQDGQTNSDHSVLGERPIDRGRRPVKRYRGKSV